jgi:hypothetical protein
MTTRQNLPHAYPRRYLPEDFDAGDRAAIQGRFDELERRSLPNAESLERFLRDWSELNEALDEEGSLRYTP